MGVDLDRDVGAVESTCLEVRDLAIGYRRRSKVSQVIHGVSFSIRRGEAYGLVGESGCGKSTIAMAVVHYLDRNAVILGGSVNLVGKDLLTTSAKEMRKIWGARIAVVYQDPATALNPSLTIGRQIAEIYVFHQGIGMSAALGEAAIMLSRVQIPDAREILTRYPHELSGGQQQRVMFAMALATNPELLVLDEPTTGLDATVEAEVLDLVIKLRNEFDTAILFISHNLGIVTRVCDRVGVLYAGRLLEEGAAEDVFSGAEHPYTRALLKCIPRSGIRKERMQLAAIPGTLPALGVRSSGCVYAPRCAYVQARCKAEEPGMAALGRRHLVACFYHEERGAEQYGQQELTGGGAPEGHEVILRVENLVKTYTRGRANTYAVRNLSFEVREGEVLGVVGESGSGKSSVAKCIAGLTEVSDGSITFKGKDIGHLSRSEAQEVRRELQIVFQNPDSALNPRHTVRRILHRSVKLLGATKKSRVIRERVLELLRSVKLQARYLDLKPSSLSGGIKQRVAIARAFSGTPSLVICDEPTSALDVSVQASILNLLARLQREKRVSYIFISHDLSVIRYLADRVIVMYLGELVEIGRAQEVLEPPYHPYTEALLSAMPTIESKANNDRIRLEGPIPSPSHPPPGCAFHTRCPRSLGELCHTTAPPWRNTGQGHMYCCHIKPQELQSMQGGSQTKEAQQF